MILRYSTKFKIINYDLKTFKVQATCYLIQFMSKSTVNIDTILKIKSFQLLHRISNSKIFLFLLLNWTAEFPQNG